ncbi:MAG: hypothetical protein V4582_06860 [Pseudomonadota bacterium]
MKNRQIMKKKSQQGSMLIESMVSILLLALGLIGAIGLQARAYSALSDADMRAEATIVSEQLLGTMSNDHAHLSKYALAAGGAPASDAPNADWYDEAKRLIPGAKIGVTVKDVGNGLTRVDIAIKWTRKTGDSENSHVVTSYMALAT